eukprot:1033553-Rhodomonas_salina.1
MGDREPREKRVDDSGVIYTHATGQDGRCVTITGTGTGTGTPGPGRVTGMPIAGETGSQSPQQLETPNPRALFPPLRTALSPPQSRSPQASSPSPTPSPASAPYTSQQARFRSASPTQSSASSSLSALVPPPSRSPPSSVTSPSPRKKTVNFSPEPVTSNLNAVEPTTGPGAESLA